MDGEIITNRSDRDVSNRLSSVIRGQSYDNAVSIFIVINLLILFMRPQNDLTVLGKIQLPFLMLFPTFIGWLPRAANIWTTQMKVMVGYLIIGAIWVPLAVNNFWAFQSFRALLQLFLAIVFPLIVFMCSGKQLRRLVGLMIFVALYLGFYTITHGGCGPGDFLGDENDVSVILVMLVPFLFVPFVTKSSAMSKIFSAAAMVLVLGAIVIASSRGGFIGLVCMAGYVIYKSHRKAAIISVLILLVGVGIWFVPDKYWEDMSTITQTDTGTAQIRKNYWKVATRVFLDPKNIIWGVGMGNIPYRVGEYEPPENKLDTGTSIAGRAVHSMYFQVIPELGLIGIGLFLTMLYASLAGNRDSVARLNRTLAEMQKLRAGPDLVRRLAAERDFLLSFFWAVNGSWFGVLASGTFVSIFYYPEIWFLAGLSAAAQLYSLRLTKLFRVPMTGEVEMPVMVSEPAR